MKVSFMLYKLKPKLKGRLKFLRHARNLLAVAAMVAIYFTYSIYSTTNAQIPTAQDIYPQGEQFPLALYSLEEVEDMQKVRSSGWNIAQTYHFKPSFLDTVAEGKMLGFASLPDEADLPPDKENEVANAIAAVANKAEVAWWEFPEEQRHWRPGEWEVVRAC
ncbi:MAG: hypothetical protein MJK14_00560 [Rivularia sp. ALOHA_DT_140]|nr:hypothetical protein [Rivularia sp. ALOHA_DT_140]